MSRLFTEILSGEPSWFLATKLRLDGQKLERFFCGVGWATTGWRSKYRHASKIGWRPVGPWEDRR